MPLLTTCAVLGFKYLIKFAAENLCEAVVPGSGELAGGLIDGLVDGAGDKVVPKKLDRQAGPSYWELGRAVCNACSAQITHGCVSHCVTCGDVDLCAACMTSRLDAGPQFHNASHMWTIYMLSKSTRGYANIDNSRSLAARPAVGATGGRYHCTGYYMQASERTAMAVDMAIDGRVICGSGHDAVGEFTIRGERHHASNRVTFQKRYATHTVEYDATLVDGAMLVGVWTIRRYDSGPFVLLLERANTADVVETATWSGYYVQWAQHFTTSLQLSIYLTGRIDGRGRDNAGSFTISGRFLDDTTTGHFLFTKKYAAHAISYEGDRLGAVMAGTYQSPATGRDAFRLEKSGY